jgi:hypothetical protein
MKTYREVEVELHALTSVLDGGEWSDSLSGRFTTGERAPSTNLIGGSVSTRAGMDAVGKRKVPVPAWNRSPIVQPVA